METETAFAVRTVPDATLQALETVNYIKHLIKAIIILRDTYEKTTWSVSSNDTNIETRRLLETLKDGIKAAKHELLEVGYPNSSVESLMRISTDKLAEEHGIEL